MPFLRRVLLRLCIPSLLLLSSLSACKDDKKDILPRHKMQAILLDINVAEVYCTMTADSTHQKGFKNADSLARFYTEIFAHHHITKDAFDRSMAWYKAHPVEMDSLAANMMTTVEAWNK